jgi:hypothetical protein
MKYKKKPVVIEAYKFTGREQWTGWPVDWLSVKHWYVPMNITTERDALMKVVIHTLEGDIAGDPGDWIIKGVKGEFYPCKDQIFRMTYEREDGSEI